jgi:hypothetical protein
MQSKTSVAIRRLPGEPTFIKVPNSHQGTNNVSEVFYHCAPALGHKTWKNIFPLLSGNATDMRKDRHSVYRRA